METSSHKRFDVYRSVTECIVAAIEQGKGNDELPWHRGAGTFKLPTNVVTEKRYRGVNVIALWAAAEMRGFSTHLWGTYRQWRSVGAQVRRGERASIIVFYKQVTVDRNEDEADERQPETRLVARASSVFNADQVDGFAPPVSTPDENIRTLHAVEDLVRRSGAVIYHGGSNAFYNPYTDHIQLPEPADFTGTSTSSPTEAYYAVLLHELVHWSGVEHRLNRDLTGRFGDRAYAMEELVAELGAAFLCAGLRITPSPRADHAGYIGHWLAVMKEDNRAIFAAASKAGEAAEYLHACAAAPPEDVGPRNPNS